jgi:hypothetical protein
MRSTRYEQRLPPVLGAQWSGLQFDLGIAPAGVGVSPRWQTNQARR